MTVDHLASHNVRVTYYAAHSGHTLNTGQLTHLPLPTSTSEAVEKKLSIGVTAERILQGKSIWLIKNTYHSIHYITFPLHSCVHGCYFRLCDWWCSRDKEYFPYSEGHIKQACQGSTKV